MFKLPKTRCVKEVAPKSRFAKNSFRYRAPAKDGTIIMFGCPKGPGHWRAGVKKKITDREGRHRTITGFCTVGTKPHAMIRQKRGVCPTGWKTKRSP